ncbi:helix-turn-helix transcriptional regulator [Bacteriovoracaceae bacterium]|nr:helix-turn-helix transcriptional regulator [Bacteriovoracaceae bacterium]
MSENEPLAKVFLSFIEGLEGRKDGQNLGNTSSYKKLDDTLRKTSLALKETKEVESLHQELKRRRKDLKMSENSMADLVGLSRSTIKKIEDGDTNVSFSNILKVAKALGIKVKWE